MLLGCGRGCWQAVVNTSSRCWRREAANTGAAGQAKGVCNGVACGDCFPLALADALLSAPACWLQVSDHPNVVNMYEVWEDASYIFIVMVSWLVLH